MGTLEKEQKKNLNLRLDRSRGSSKKGLKKRIRYMVPTNQYQLFVSHLLFPFWSVFGLY